MIDPAERKLGGIVSGVLWGLGGLTLAGFPLLPGVTHAHTVATLAIGAGAASWGATSLFVINWEKAPPLLIQLSTAASFGAIAGAVASTGGARSAAWIYLFYVGLFAAYFYTRGVAIAYLLMCVAVHALPLAYDHRALHDGFLATMITSAAGYLSIGGAVIAGKALLTGLRNRAEHLAAEQGAMQRVATAVVRGDSPGHIYGVAATELAELLNAGTAAIVQLGRQREATVVGSSDAHHAGRFRVGRAETVSEDDEIGWVLAHLRPLTSESQMFAPVRVSGETWGVVVAEAGHGRAFSESDEQQLVAFGELIAGAIASIEERASLAVQAMTDPLTGLANHRTLQQRLAEEVAGARRHGRPLSVAMIDIDNFKEINDSAGHDAGDATLERVATCLRSLARAEDTIGRPGGDEFMWILPDTNRVQALVAVERARELIGSTVRRPLRVTASAGICDLETTTEPAELVRLADMALYWSKAHGRNRTRVYDRRQADDLSAALERSERSARDQAIVGLRALARAIDAKDPATREHSERVAALSGKLAQMAGWPEDRVAALREAALVHDVGKIGVPDAVLAKSGPLSVEESEQIRLHPELSARIVGGVLSREQVEWIRNHHERPDGTGYPRELIGSAVPDGAALIALADAFDVMTVGRSYGRRKTVEETLEECVALSGLQFSEAAIAALLALDEAGELRPGVEPGTEQLLASG